MSEWACPSCPYRIRMDHPPGGVKEAIKEHQMAHKYPLTDRQKEELWRDATRSTGSPSKGASA